MFIRALLINPIAAIAVLVLACSTLHAATPSSQAASAPTVHVAQDKSTTIDGITNLVRQKLTEGLKTDVLVTKAAGAKAEREIQGVSTLPLGGNAPMGAHGVPQRPVKKPKEEFMTMPTVASITGVGTKLQASLSNGKTVVPGDGFPLGDNFVTVDGISKQAVTFRRCKKDKCTVMASKVSGF